MCVIGLDGTHPVNGGVTRRVEIVEIISLQPIGAEIAELNDFDSKRGGM